MHFRHQAAILNKRHHSKSNIRTTRYPHAQITPKENLFLPNLYFLQKFKPNTSTIIKAFEENLVRATQEPKLKKKERNPDQSMIMVCESSFAWESIWSNWSVPVMGSISIEVGPETPCQKASAFDDPLLGLFLSVSLSLSLQLLLLIAEENPKEWSDIELESFEGCGSWWWSCLQRRWEFAGKTAIGEAIKRKRGRWGVLSSWVGDDC